MNSSVNVGVFCHFLLKIELSHNSLIRTRRDVGQVYVIKCLLFVPFPAKSGTEVCAMVDGRLVLPSPTGDIPSQVTHP